MILLIIVPLTGTRLKGVMKFGFYMRTFCWHASI